MPLTSALARITGEKRKVCLTSPFLTRKKLSSMDKNIINRYFAKLGLSAESGATYCYILENSPISLEALSTVQELSDIDFIKALHELANHRLIFVDGKQIWVMNPKTAFSALAKESDWLEHGVFFVNPDADETPDKNFSKVCSEVSEYIGSSYQYKSPIAHSRLKLARDPETLVTMLSEATRRVKSTICAISTSPRLPLRAIFWDVLVEKLEEGINYTRIADLDEVEEHGYEIVKRDVEKLRVRLFIQNPNVMTDKFYIFDDDCVVFFEPLGRGFGLTGQLVANKLVATKCKKLFDQIISTAVPAEKVLELMEDERTRILGAAKEFLSPRGYKWLHKVCNNGVFFSPAMKADLSIPTDIEKCLNLGLIRKRVQYGTMEIYVPAYRWNLNEFK